MAKNPQPAQTPATPASPQANENKGPLPFVNVSVKPFSVKVRESVVTHESGTLEGNSYAIAYGYRQSMQDSIAGVLAGVNQTAKKASGNWTWDKITDAAKDWGLITSLPISLEDKGGLKVFGDLLANTIVADRLADIMAGKVQSRSVGPRLKGIDQVMRDICDEYIAADAEKRQKRFPSGEKLQALRAYHLAKDGENIRRKAQARMDELAARTPADDEDIEDLWADEESEPKAA